MSAPDLLARIEAAFEEGRSLDKRIRVEVPEWRATLFFAPDITLARRKTILAGVSKTDEGAQMASYIMHEAQLEDGTPAFEVSVQTLATLESMGGSKLLLRIMAELGKPQDIGEVKNA